MNIIDAKPTAAGDSGLRVSAWIGGMRAGSVGRLFELRVTLRVAWTGFLLLLIYLDTTPHRTGPPDVGRISITVSGGVATLAGTARSLAEGQAVIAAARAVPHLDQIDNRLRINPNI